MVTYRAGRNDILYEYQNMFYICITIISSMMIINPFNQKNHNSFFKCFTKILRLCRHRAYNAASGRLIYQPANETNPKYISWEDRRNWENASLQKEPLHKTESLWTYYLKNVSVQCPRVTSSVYRNNISNIPYPLSPCGERWGETSCLVVTSSVITMWCVGPHFCIY